MYDQVVVNFRVSAIDQAAQEAVYFRNDPHSAGPYALSIPDNLVFEDVEFEYQIDASEDERQLWIRCCACRHDHNHKHGFVMRFEGGHRVTVGVICAKTKHYEHYKRYKGFQAQRARASSIHAIMAALAQRNALAGFLWNLKKDVSVTSLYGFRVRISTKLPELDYILTTYPGGQLKDMQRVIDTSEEVARSDKLERRLERLARDRNLNRSDPAVDSQLIVELRAANDPLASTDRIYKEEIRVIAEYTGTEFVQFVTGYRAEIDGLLTSYDRVLNRLDGKSSENFSDRQLSKIAADLGALLKDVEVVINKIKNAFGFVEPSNLKTIIDYANESSLNKKASKFVVQNGNLSRLEPDPIDVPINVQQLNFSTSAFHAVRAAVDDRSVQTAKRN